MKMRQVIGKRITGVRQTRSRYCGHTYYDIYALILEDGTEIRFMGIEDEDGGELGVQAVVVRP